MPGLFEGMTGVAWVAGHLGRDDEILGDIDDVLVDLLSDYPDVADYDLARGLVGYGAYALERLDRPRAREIASRVVALLEARAAPDGSWWTAAELLPPDTRRLYPAGWCDLGLAHGAAGAIALLARCVALEVEAERARPLLARSVDFLLSQRLGPDSPSRWPGRIAPGEEPSPARAAWCRGDPGAAIALVLAARAARQPAWERAGLEAAAAAARRDAAGSGVVDAGLCHGAAGLAHLLGRLHAMTGAPELRAAALFWFARTLDYGTAGEGIGGFRFLRPVPGGGSMQDDPSLLTGSAGVALALQAALSDDEPAWDRVMLLSIGGQPASM